MTEMISYLNEESDFYKLNMEYEEELRELATQVRALEERVGSIRLEEKNFEADLDQFPFYSEEEINKIKSEFKDRLEPINNKILSLNYRIFSIHYKKRVAYILSPASDNDRLFLSNKNLDNKKEILNDFEKVSIIVSFSGMSKIKDKNLSRIHHRKFKGLQIRGTGSHLPSLPKILNEIKDTELIGNRRDNYSLIASTVFTNAEKFMKKIYLERLNDKKYLFDYCTTLFKTLDPINMDTLYVTIREPVDTVLFYAITFPNGKRKNVIFGTMKNILLIWFYELNKGKKNKFLFLSKSLIKNSLFIFCGYKWSTVITEFKKKSIWKYQAVMGQKDI